MPQGTIATLIIVSLLSLSGLSLSGGIPGQEQPGGQSPNPGSKVKAIKFRALVSGRGKEISGAVVIVEGEKITVEGTYKFAGGDGQYRNVTGSGKFKTVLSSATEVDCTWEGKYTLAKAHAR